MMPNWLLPEYIQDTLPEEAWRIEIVRGKVLELMRLNGYQLVVPPMLEYVESLLINNSEDMDRRSFKLVDQISGRTMALRADITPQAARIDAHLMNCQGVTRLCYAGSVLHTQPSGLMRTREPMQVGAELYGHSGLASDLEVQKLMLQVLKLIGIGDVHIDLGHVCVFRAIVRLAKIDDSLESDLFAALQRKDVPVLKNLVADLPEDVSKALIALTQLYGPAEEVLKRARIILPAHDKIRDALNELEQAASALHSLAEVGIDLAELRGYHYHSGMVFAAYHSGSHDAIAQGGRYDDLGQSFGRARPATGFSMDLRQLLPLLPYSGFPKGILAPDSDDLALIEEIRRLRSEGHAVVVDLLGNAELRNELNCDRELIRKGSGWIVSDLK